MKSRVLLKLAGLVHAGNISDPEVGHLIKQRRRVNEISASLLSTLEIDRIDDDTGKHLAKYVTFLYLRRASNAPTPT